MLAGRAVSALAVPFSHTLVMPLQRLLAPPASPD
jgi:hypothetical protein